MGFLVLFRRERSKSPFRSFLHALLEFPGAEEIVLASGYVWESPSTRGYRVSRDGIAERLKRQGHRRVVTVGGMHHRPAPFGADYEQHYVEFVRALRNAGVVVDPYVSTSGRWHAKVALAVMSGSPVAGIVGSSNLTGPAYGVHRRVFNNETDVVLWTSAIGRDHFLPVLADLDLPADEYIVGDISDELPQPSEQERLDTFLADLLDPNGIEPLNQ